MSAPSTSAVIWFRRDLRLDDHAALARATHDHAQVHAVFVLDPAILDAQPRGAGRRVAFLLAALRALDDALRAAGAGLHVLRGAPDLELPRFALACGAVAVHANRDHEPAAIERDTRVRRALEAAGIAFRTAKDHVVAGHDEVLTRAGGPYAVFTPYRTAWLRYVDEFGLPSHDPAPARLAPAPPLVLPDVRDLGFDRAFPRSLDDLGISPSPDGARRLLDGFAQRIDHYHERRDYPAVKGPSYLAPHLRFGTLSIRTAARLARSSDSAGAQTWLSELAWRDFYAMLLAQHPRVVDRSFRPEYDAVEWDDSPLADERLAAWREGRTGFPLVDAGMRQLQLTGYMHNRLRMVVASFLTKDLHVDWRRGADHFAAELLDHDLASNNGGWQWAASTGADAQPYFRIFNPTTQSQRFDPEGKFIRRYVPELARVPDRYVHAPWTMPGAEQSAAGCVIGRDYPGPIVEHDVERRITLARYAKVKAT